MQGYSGIGVSGLFHPPFDYLKDNGQVMRTVEQVAWNYDPKVMGYAWDEETKQDYQRHFPEGYGYAVLRPVRKLTGNEE